MLNILIRTSERPNSFKRLINSIEQQSEGLDLKLWVSVDNDAKYPYEILYETALNWSIIQVEKSTIPFGYNLYLNTLLDNVSQGWVYIVDDDDYVLPYQLQRLYYSLTKEDYLYLFRILLNGTHDVPNRGNFDRDTLIRGQISMSGFAFHSKHKDLSRFQARISSDFWYAVELKHKLKRWKWLQIRVVATGNMGLKGNMNDIDESKINDYGCKTTSKRVMQVPGARY